MTRVFKVDEVREHKAAFQMVFGSPAGQQVLELLEPFCRASQTCVVPGKPDMTSVLEGRREVWLRIQDYLNLPAEAIIGKHYRPVRISDDRDTDPHTGT